MKSYKLTYLLIILAFVMCISSPLKASQNFEFYYQTVTNIEDIGTTKQDGDNIFTKIGKTAKQGVNDIKELWQEGVTNSNIHSTGEKKWYSSQTKNLVYTVKREKVNSREELIEKIGVPEDQMTEGQKALLDCYDMAYSQAIEERSKYSYRDPIRVVFTDTSDTDWSYTDANGNIQTVATSTFQHDFWSWSNGNTIHMATHNYNSESARNRVKSTFLHEYCHSIDKTNKELINPYGYDGSHYGNELTKPKAAFVEGWAEYNEMIEFPDRAKSYMNEIATICVELNAKQAAKKDLDPEKEGKNCEGGWFKSGDSTYIYVSPASMTAEDLWKCESYNRAVLYRFATELDDGKQKVYDAFIKSRGKLGRDLKTFVKEFCKQNPDDTAKIGAILDELSYGKMTDKEMKKFIGNSKEAKAYLKERAATSGSNSSNSSSLGDKISDITASISSSVASTTQKVSDSVASATKSIKNAIGNFVEKVKETAKKVVEVVKDTVNKVVDFFKNLFGKKSKTEETTTTEEIKEETTTETTTEVENIENEENEEQEEVIETVDTVTTSDENTSELIGTSDQEGDIFNIR